jgi:feruloyl esterase
VIENPTRCRYDYASLLCKGADNPACLTGPQVESAKALVSPLMHPVTGKVLFEGHLWPGAEPEWARLSRPEPLDNVLTRVRNITFRDPHWEPRQFNIATDVDRADTIDKGLLASSNFNLKPFFDRGGKLLMWHGWSDPQVTPQNSIIYYNTVLKTVGSGADQSIALFMLPGVSHCQGGPGPDTFDKMGAMEQWVEHGRRPTRLIAAHMTRGKVDRTRPLCLYGQVARWNGKGSTDDAASFSCVAESMETSAR